MDTQEARLYIAIITTVILIVVIIVYFALSVIRQQRRYIALQKANALAEISAMEKERARIAADLHDDLGPLLAVVKFRVDHVEPVNEDEKAELKKASSQLDELVNRLREVANDLMPSVLQRKGLVPAILDYINQVSSAGALRISFTDNTLSPIDEQKSIHIFRILQETIHNCLRHSGATEMNICLEEEKSLLKMRCQDNGKGFDLSKVMKDSNGIGMRSLKNRSEMMKGRMEVDTRPGKGSCFIFEIPLR